MTWRLLHAVSDGWHPPLFPVTGLASLDADSFDSLVTDPPAGIGFMGMAWDLNHGGRDLWIAKMSRAMAACLRVLKPGAYGLVWALPRTSHWTATALENGGFEVCDVHHHLFGSGFPKHKSKLKPAAEHWILVRKPAPRATPLNIDACRIGYSSDAPDAGRWPAHVSLDEEAAAMLDEQAGRRRSSGPCGASTAERKDGGITLGGLKKQGQTYADDGGASRFFFVAKAAKSERGAGNDHPTVKSLALMDWLLRLITPPGGHVLDPFAGSGTTLVAAQRAGFHATGIEQHERYVEIARARLAADAPLFNDEASTP